MVFTNPFFSLAGQAERLKNVADVLSIAVNPFSKDKITANVSSPVLKSGLEFVSNNPYTTAAIVAIPASATARSAISSGISSLSTTTKVISGGAALVTGGAVANNPALISPIIKTASGLTPESLVKFGGSVGTATAKPSFSNISNIAKENPILTTALLSGAAFIAAKPLSNALNFTATSRNTAAINEQNKLIKDFKGDNEDGTTKQDVKIAELNAKSLLKQEQEKTKQAELLAKSQEKQLQLQLKALELQSKQQKTPEAVTPETVIKKKKKKRTSKKKPKKKAKKKPKKKTTKKRTKKKKRKV